MISFFLTVSILSTAKPFSVYNIFSVLLPGNSPFIFFSGESAEAEVHCLFFTGADNISASLLLFL